MRKRIISLFLCIVFLSGLLISCSKDSSDKNAAHSTYRVSLEDGVIGKWKWFNGINVYIRNNGTVSNSENGTGVWYVSDRNRNQVTIRWNEGGWIDELSLSPDGNNLDGRNQNGVHVFGIRVK